MVLVDEAKAGGTPGRECPRGDQDIRQLAGVTKPAGVTVCDDGIGSPCVGRGGGTLSSSDIAGRLLPVVPTGGGGGLPSWPYRPRWPGYCMWPRWDVVPVHP